MAGTVIHRLRSYRRARSDGGAESIKMLYQGRYIHGLLNPVAGTAAVILMHGAGGGMHGPASIYAELAEELAERGIETLRINARFPTDLKRCVKDLLASIEYLAGHGKERFGVVGWSFGGAVVIETAAEDSRVAAVVTIATQGTGTRNVWRISPRPILLIHGEADRTLPWRASENVYERAGEPRRLVLYPNSNHGIEQDREEMLALVRDWLVERLLP